MTETEEQLIVKGVPITRPSKFSKRILEGSTGDVLQIPTLLTMDNDYKR